MSAPRLSAKGYLAVLPVMMKNQIRQERFEYYLTDALWLVNENFAAALGGRTLEERFSSLVNPKPEDTRTEEEVIAQVKKGWEVKMP